MSDLAEKIKGIRARSFAGSSVRDGWIYHDLPFVGLMGGQKTHRKGTRERIEQIASLVDFRGKSVLDLGCSVGGMSLGAVEKGAKSVLGIDHDPQSIAVAREAAKQLGWDAKVDFAHGGIDPHGAYGSQIVLFLSSWMWVVKAHGMESSLDMLWDISVRSDVLVFESAADDGEAALKGYTQDDIRTLLHDNTCYQKIVDYPSADGRYGRRIFVCSAPKTRWKNKREAYNAKVERIGRGIVSKTFKPRFAWMADREVLALSLLEGSRHFPRVISWEEGKYLMAYSGRSDMVKPGMWDQALEILKQLRDAGVRHRDIRAENLLAKEGVLYLIDFGWCLFDGEDELDWLPPERIRVADDFADMSEVFHKLDMA